MKKKTHKKSKGEGVRDTREVKYTIKFQKKEPKHKSKHMIHHQRIIKNIQFSPLIILYLESIRMISVMSEPFYKGTILERN